MGGDGRRLRIAFVLTALGLGGAEMMLWKILSRIDRARFEPILVVLSSHADALLDRFRSLAIDCRFVGMRGAADGAAGVFRLRTLMRSVKPDLVQGWMYQGNIAATLAAVLNAGRPPVLWAVRAGLTDLAREEWRVALPIRAGAKLSFVPARIVNNSLASAVEHEETLGYRADKRVIIPNGFDVDLFRPRPEAHLALRRALGIPDDACIVGLAARYHWVKDHATFLRAAREASAVHPGTHYVLVGDDIDRSNAALCGLIRECGLEPKVHLLGRRSDMQDVTAAFDIAVSSSIAEGFPNVIGEAMSCGVPCVATDAGDCARIIADTGRVVPVGDAWRLARALSELIAIGDAARRALGEKARQRIVEHYALDAVVQQYEALYSAVHRERAAQRH